MKILITGSSTGFGKLFSDILVKKGHTVVASMRGIGGKNKTAAQELKSLGANVVEIDVTDEKSVEAGVAKAIEVAGGLDVVINNAGTGVLGLQETYTVEDWKKVFEVNVFGVQRVNRAVLPHFRKKNSGLLMHISSILGRMTLPFFGPYNATKWALEAMAENYRTELSGFGVDSCIVEPGGYATEFMNKLVKGSDSAREAGYGDMAKAPMQMMEGFEKNLAQNKAQDPKNVAEVVLKIIETPAGERPFRTVIDKMGMGDMLQGYNAQLEQITTGIYGAFGIGDMLKLKVPAQKA